VNVKRIVFVAILSSISFLAASCDQPTQAEYSQLKERYETVSANVSRYQNQFSDLQGKYQKLEQDVKNLKAEKAALVNALTNNGTCGVKSKKSNLAPLACVYAKMAIKPNIDPCVEYDPKKRRVTARFKTPAEFNVRYHDLWKRWRDNQTAVLREFIDRDISVKEVVMITNYKDGSGLVKAVTSDESVLLYAKDGYADQWLDNSRLYQKKPKEKNWKSMPK
jgi:anti-sigma-K factor RskA